MGKTTTFTVPDAIAQMLARAMPAARSEAPLALSFRYSAVESLLPSTTSVHDVASPK